MPVRCNGRLGGLLRWVRIRDRRPAIPTRCRTGDGANEIEASDIRLEGLGWPEGPRKDLRHGSSGFFREKGGDTRGQCPGGRSDPRLTMSTYVHLTPDYLRDEIDRLAFAPAAPAERETDVQEAVAGLFSLDGGSDAGREVGMTG